MVYPATIDGRNLIFCHKLHIGTPYRGKRFWTHQIPTSCLPILLIFKSDGSKNATHNMVYLYDAYDQISDFCHQQLLRKMRRKILWTDGRTDRGKTVTQVSYTGSWEPLVCSSSIQKESPDTEFM
jgi:hypothetical protein